MTDSFHRTLDAAMSRVDIQPYLEAAREAAREIASLLLPEENPPLCRQQIPSEGQE